MSIICPLTSSSLHLSTFSHLSSPISFLSSHRPSLLIESLIVFPPSSEIPNFPFALCLFHICLLAFFLFHIFELIPCFEQDTRTTQKFRPPFLVSDFFFPQTTFTASPFLSSEYKIVYPVCATCKNIEFLPCLSVNLLLFANFLILIPTASTCFWSRSGSVYSSFVLNSSTGTFRISLPLSPPFLFVRFTFFFPPFIFIFYWQFHYHLINV